MSALQTQDVYHEWAPCGCLILWSPNRLPPFFPPNCSSHEPHCRTCLKSGVLESAVDSTTLGLSRNQPLHQLHSASSLAWIKAGVPRLMSLLLLLLNRHPPKKSLFSIQHQRDPFKKQMCYTPSPCKAMSLSGSPVLTKAYGPGTVCFPMPAPPLTSLLLLARCSPHQATPASLLLKHTKLLCILQSSALIFIQVALPLIQNSIYIWLPQKCLPQHTLYHLILTLHPHCTYHNRVFCLRPPLQVNCRRAGTLPITAISSSLTVPGT